MRVEGHLVYALAELLVVSGELIRVAGRRDQMLDGLPVVATAQCRATFARTTGNDQREARVARACPEHRAAESRRAEDGNALRVYTLVGFEIIERAAQTPTPCRNGSPLVRRRHGLSRLELE